MAFNGLSMTASSRHNGDCRTGDCTTPRRKDSRPANVCPEWPLQLLAGRQLGRLLSVTLTCVLLLNSLAPATTQETKPEAESSPESMEQSAETILVTGGAGYIGSHCVVALLERHYSVIVIDNLVNSIQLPDSPLPESLARAEEIAGWKLVRFYKGDIADRPLLEDIFRNHSITGVMHFAALKAVSESVAKPLEYYQNNVGGTLTLLDVMKQFGVKKFVFSSSATVYGAPQYLPLDEDHPTGSNIANPYGRGKAMVETVLKDLAESDPEWSVISLRYFNPIGAHTSGRIGEDPADIPNNLMPFITQVAVGRRKELSIFGADYDTEDGTAIRDYIHIDDLISGHLAALDRMRLAPDDWKGFHPLNLGTGQGTSVMGMVTAFEEATGIKIAYRITARRTGDVPVLCANASRANQTLQWVANKTVRDACADSWRWQSQNPNGYRPATQS